MPIETSTITISDILIIMATFLGPIIAVQTQKFVERWNEKKNRKLIIFYTLMATRANCGSDRHVEALNMIDMEYNDCKSGKGKGVWDAWRIYHAHLNEKDPGTPVWGSKREDHFVSLLYEMSKFLGYDYNKVEIKNNCYSPIAQEERNAVQEIVSKGLADVFIGKKSFPVKIIDDSKV